MVSTPQFPVASVSLMCHPTFPAATRASVEVAGSSGGAPSESTSTQKPGTGTPMTQWLIWGNSPFSVFDTRSCPSETTQPKNLAIFLVLSREGSNQGAKTFTRSNTWAPKQTCTRRLRKKAYTRRSKSDVHSLSSETFSALALICDVKSACVNAGPTASPTVLKERTQRRPWKAVTVPQKARPKLRQRQTNPRRLPRSRLLSSRRSQRLDRWKRQQSRERSQRVDRWKRSQRLDRWKRPQEPKYFRLRRSGGRSQRPMLSSSVSQAVGATPILPWPLQTRCLF